MNHFKTNILFLVFLLAASAAKAEITIGSVHCICGPTSHGSITIIASGTAGLFSFQWSPEWLPIICTKP